MTDDEWNRLGVSVFLCSLTELREKVEELDPELLSGRHWGHERTLLMSDLVGCMTTTMSHEEVVERVRLLLPMSDPSLRDKDGMSALDFAVYLGGEAVASVLIPSASLVDLAKAFRVSEMAPASVKGRMKAAAERVAEAIEREMERQQLEREVGEKTGPESGSPSSRGRL